MGQQRLLRFAVANRVGISMSGPQKPVWNKGKANPPAVEAGGSHFQ